MRLLVVVTLTCLLVSSALAQPEAVIAAEMARRTALLQADAAALGSLLADDLRYTHSSGKVESKAEVVAGIASRQVAYERFELTALDARPVTADVVVVTGRIDQRKFSSGRWSDLKLLFHAVWRRDPGGWRQVSLQTLQPPAPPPTP